MAAEVLRECANWVRQQNNIQHVFTSHGGWEKWAQIDFGGYLRSKGLQVALNDTCFENSDSMDDFTVHSLACVQLKTYGHQYNVPEPIQAYRSRMQAAQSQFENLRLNTENRENDKFCIGIANQDDVVSGLRHMFNNNNISVTNYTKTFRTVFGQDYEHAVVSSPSGARWIISFCRVN